MRSIVPIAEQLDRALAELAIDHPLNGRIALILVDNGLELMCHQKCADLLFEDRHRNSRRLTPEQRSDARGRAFDRKMQFLKDLGHIPPDQVRAMAILHEYRNQLYHVGLRDDPIIGQLAHLGVGNEKAVPETAIVDGQQRLTSLYAVVKGAEVLRANFKKERIRIAFSPLTEKFEVTDAAILKDKSVDFR